MCTYIYTYIYAYAHTFTYVCIHTMHLTVQRARELVAWTIAQDDALINGTHCLQHTASHCNTLQHTATHCNTLQHTSSCCHTLQHSAAHCNTPKDYPLINSTHNV